MKSYLEMQIDSTCLDMEVVPVGIIGNYLVVYVYSVIRTLKALIKKKNIHLINVCNQFEKSNKLTHKANEMGWIWIALDSTTLPGNFLLFPDPDAFLHHFPVSQQLC